MLYPKNFSRRLPDSKCIDLQPFDFSLQAQRQAIDFGEGEIGGSCRWLAIFAAQVRLAIFYQQFFDGE